MFEHVAHFSAGTIVAPQRLQKFTGRIVGEVLQLGHVFSSFMFTTPS